MEININYLELADDYQKKGMLDLAIENYNKAVNLEPNNIKIYNKLAITYYYKNDFESAIKNYKKIVEISPDYAMPYNNMGLISFNLQNFDEAIKNYKKAIETNPDYYSAYNNLGNAYYKINLIDKAIESYKKAVEKNSNYVDAYINLGNLFYKERNFKETIIYFEKAIELNVNIFEIYNNLGIAYREEKEEDKAIECFLKADGVKPNNQETYGNLAISYHNKKLFRKAIEFYKKSLELKPDNYLSYYGLGVTYVSLREIDNAISAYKKALEIKPEYYDCRLNLGIAYLLNQDFENGWKYYEDRFYVVKNSIPEFSQPRWNGENLEGKTIYVVKEQGLGDIIQFIRFLPMLKQRYNPKKIIFKTLRTLEYIIQSSNFMAEMDMVEIIDQHFPDKNIEFDTYIPLLSLPYVMKINERNISYAQGYLKADAELVNAYKNNFFNTDKFKLGIFWQGNTANTADGQRSVPLEYFYPIFNLPDIQFYSLQKGFGLEQLEELPQEYNVIDLCHVISDFSDTAAVINNLDLVITIDTAVAHLCGAMGKKAWIVLPEIPEWRWCLDEHSTIWYDSIRLFRAKPAEDRRILFDKMRDELQELI